ncbi:FAD-dependent oxidoreductase [Actinoallomurus iriomotensis]|uniref:FAD-dependent oxidoreductase n=1 Tax=Actinoallomurus iriomotensis TaxID=478107 RepID=UPI003D7F410B
MPQPRPRPFTSTRPSTTTGARSSAACSADSPGRRGLGLVRGWTTTKVPGRICVGGALQHAVRCDGRAEYGHDLLLRPCPAPSAEPSDGRPTAVIGLLDPRGRRCRGLPSRAPAIPDVPGLREARPWTNREATSTRQTPKRLIVIGGGPVACEMTQALHALGAVESIILVREDRLLTRTEPFAGELVSPSLAESASTCTSAAHSLGSNARRPAGR